MIHCHCPHCQTPYELEDALAGHKLRCDACERAFVWLAAEGRAEAIREPAAAAPDRPASAVRWPWTVLAATGLAAVLAAGACALRRPSSPPADVPHAAAGPAAERARDYAEARARAQERKLDLVVFQRGSDWNRLSEMLYREVWQTAAFARALGAGFILVAVDHPEVAGRPSVLDSVAGAPAADSPPDRLSALAGDQAALPHCEITAVEARNGTVLKSRADGAWLAEGANPGQELLTLKLKTVSSGSVLRLDFPTDPSLPGGGPGRAGNGNFALTEIALTAGGRPLSVAGAWANAAEGAWGPWQAVDGVTNKPDNLWNAAAHHHVRRTLLLALAAAVPAGADVEVRLLCASQWGQHVPGCLRAAVLPERKLAADVCGVAAALREQAANQAFDWWDRAICPRIALLDSEGRAVACENKPRLDLTPDALAARVKDLRAVREQRDALWAAAAQTQGVARAELLRQGLDLLGFANWPGNGNGYKSVHDQIRAADPRDESGAVRWLGFGGDPKSGVPWAEPTWAKALDKKDLTDADYAEALARIDKELKDPRNRVLDHERIQRIMVAKYHVYKRWPNHQEQRFDVQRAIAAFDPTTFWGIGAVGYLGMYHRAPTPLLTFGWTPAEVKPGANVWNLTDTAYAFDHAGPYLVRLSSTGGKDLLKVRRVALLDGPKVLAEVRPGADVGPGKGPVEVTLDYKDWRADRAVVLRVDADAAPGCTNSAGSFAVEPQLLPPPAGRRAAPGRGSGRCRGPFSPNSFWP